MLDEGRKVSRTYLGDGPYAELEKEYNAAISSVAETFGLPVLPFHEAFESVSNGTGYLDRRFAGYLLQRDGVHPNPWGRASSRRPCWRRCFLYQTSALCFFGMSGAMRSRR